MASELNQQEDKNISRKDGSRCPFCQRQFQTLEELTHHLVTRHTQPGLKRGPAQAGGEK